jgi:predicted nucleotide-binding protein (sugar kinase/HSP70/actin superfamily)
VFGKVDKQSQKLTSQLNTLTEKYLSRLEKQEQKLKRKLWRTDSAKAKEVFGNVEERYSNLRNQLSTNSPQQFSSIYSARADSLTTALTFLNENPLMEQAKGISSNLKNVTALQNKFNQTEQIRKQIKARQEALKQQLQNKNRKASKTGKLTIGTKGLCQFTL